MDGLGFGPATAGSVVLAARRSWAGRRARYRVGDSAASDRALARRGDIRGWVPPDAVADWRAPAGRRTFSAAAITAALMMRAVWRLALRQVEGLIASLFGLLGVALPVPDHTTLSRRGRRLRLDLRSTAGIRLNLAIDSTGLHVRRPRGERGEGWRKLPIAVDLDSGGMLAEELTRRRPTCAWPPRSTRRPRGSQEETIRRADRQGLGMRTTFIEANGLRFEVLEEGSGDRLALCLHGFPEHAVSWRHQIAVLAGMGYRVWAVNQRGYGRTTRPARVADYALPHLVDDVAALIDAANARRVALLGHDWGGMVAWCLAAGKRRPLERLVVMNDPHPLCFRAALKHWRQLRKSWYVAFFQLPWLPERMLMAGRGAMVRRMFAGVPLPPDVLAVYTGQVTEPGTATAMLNWYRALRLPSSRALDLAQVIDVPTLVVWGERDVALDPVCLDGTERYVRDLTVKRLPGVSHWVQQDAPLVVNELLREFLR